MLQVVVLHEVVILQLLVDERQQVSPQYIDVQVSGHDSIEDANLCTAVSAYSGPHIQFQGMFWLWFSFRRFTNFPITSTVELFEGDRAFVSKNDVVESISSL